MKFVSIRSNDGVMRGDVLDGDRMHPLVVTGGDAVP
jgi:hypothetical protein